jgi:hypothetical protein
MAKLPRISFMTRRTRVKKALPFFRVRKGTLPFIDIEVVDLEFYLFGYKFVIRINKGQRNA